MKKAITILAMIAIVACAVFAVNPESHSIKVKADVSEVLPVFQLKLTTGTYNQQAGETYTTNSGKELFGTSNHEELTDQTAKDVNFNLDQGGVVNVAVYIANNAKTEHAYTLAFGGGAFKKIYRHNVLGDDVEPTIASSNGDAIANFYTIATGDTILGNNKKVVVTFQGKTIKNDQLSNALATATYTYEGDDEIDLGTYYADISLTIQSN